MTRQALQYSYTYLVFKEHNRQKFGALLQSIIGNFKSIIGSSLPHSIQSNMYMHIIDSYMATQRDGRERNGTP